MSATQSRFGAGGYEVALDQVVGDPHARHADRRAALALRGTSPESPRARISRSTRLRPTRTSSLTQRRRGSGGRRRCRGSRAWISRIRSISQASASARSDGGRRSQAWKPERETPSIRHISEIGWLAFSAAMNRKQAHRVSLSRAKKAAAFFKISRSCSSVRTLPAQLAQLLALLARQPLTLAARRPRPAAPTSAATRSRSRDRRRSLSAARSDRAIQRDRLTPELRRVRLLEVRPPWHGGRSFLPSRTMPTKRSGVHENGGIPFGSLSSIQQLLTRSPRS